MYEIDDMYDVSSLSGHDLEVLGGIFGDIGHFIKKATRSIGKITKSVLKSPYLKVGISGLAIAFPAVGIPAAAALVTAEKVVDAANQAHDIAKRTGAIELIENTRKSAAHGDKDAKRAMATIKQVEKLKKVSGGKSIFEAGAITTASPTAGVLVTGKTKVHGTFKRISDGNDTLVLKDGYQVRGKFQAV